MEQFILDNFFTIAGIILLIVVLAVILLIISSRGGNQLTNDAIGTGSNGKRGSYAKKQKRRRRSR